MVQKITDMKTFVAKVATGEILDEKSAEQAFNILMSGDATPAQIGGFLMGLRVRGEAVSEITGAARAMRAKALFIEAPNNAIDIVGTGGDGTAHTTSQRGLPWWWLAVVFRLLSMVIGRCHPNRGLQMS